MTGEKDTETMTAFSVNGKPIGVPRGRGDIAAAGVPVAFDDYKMLIKK